MFNDYFVNKKNTPNVELYTLLLGLFFAFSGINFILSYLVYRQSNIFVSDFLMMGIILLITTPIVIMDRRKENRGVKAVVLSVLMHIFCTLICVCSLQFWALLVVYMAELLFCAILTIYLKRKK